MYLLYTGGTTGMPKGVMWRQEDVYFALGGGIDAMSNERVTSPFAASEKIDASLPAGGRFLPIPPLMHGAGQFSVLRGAFEGNCVVLIDQFDAEEVWRLVDRHKVNGIMVTGDAMARPLADALEKLKDELDLSSLLVVQQHCRDLLADGQGADRRGCSPNIVMTDSIGSTESGMNGIRLVQKGDAPKEGITTVLASADTVVLDDDLNPLEPGYRGGRPARARRQHPARLLQRSREDRRDVRHRRAGPALVDPGRLRVARSRRPHHVARTRLGVDQLGRREDLPRGGRGCA